MLPPHLITLLSENAHLRASNRIIVAAITTLKSEIEATKATRAPFDYISVYTKKPGATNQKITQLTNDLAEYNIALERISKIDTKQHKVLIDKLERYVCETSEPYRKGLAAVSNIADWEQALERFQLKLLNYLKALGEARNSIAAGYDRVNKQFSPNGQRALSIAIVAGEELEVETNFINHIADLHRSAVTGTQCHSLTLPIVPQADYAMWTRRLGVVDIASSQQECNRILEMCEMLSTQGLNIMLDAIKNLKVSHTTSSLAFVESYLTTLQKFADEQMVNPAETETLVLQVEQKYKDL